MKEFSENEMYPVTFEYVLGQAQTDLENWRRFAMQVYEEMLREFFDQNPNWPHRSELEKLNRRQNRNMKDEQRIQELMTMIKPWEDIQKTIANKYATSKNWQLIDT